MNGSDELFHALLIPSKVLVRCLGIPGRWPPPTSASGEDVWATADAAWEATLATSSEASLLGSVSHCWSLGVVQQVATGCGKVHIGMAVRSQRVPVLIGSWWDMADSW